MKHLIVGREVSVNNWTFFIARLIGIIALVYLLNAARLLDWSHPVVGESVTRASVGSRP